MTEKRFQVTDNTDNPFLCDWSVTDYGDGGIVHHPMTSENMANVMCNLLNELHEENEFLKSNYKDLVQFVKSKGYTLKEFISFIGQFQSVGVNKEDWK